MNQGDGHWGSIECQLRVYNRKVQPLARLVLLIAHAVKGCEGCALPIHHGLLAAAEANRILIKASIQHALDAFVNLTQATAPCSMLMVLRLSDINTLTISGCRALWLLEALPSELPHRDLLL